MKQIIKIPGTKSLCTPGRKSIQQLETLIFNTFYREFFSKQRATIYGIEIYYSVQEGEQGNDSVILYIPIIQDEEHIEIDMEFKNIDDLEKYVSSDEFKNTVKRIRRERKASAKKTDPD